MPDDLFESDDLDTFAETDASPVIDDEAFRGIRIALPQRLVLGSFESLPVRGTHVFQWPWYRKFEYLNDAFVFLARNVDSHQSYCGTFRWEDHPVPFEEAPGEELAGEDRDQVAPTEGLKLSSQGWFNFDLCRVWQLPETPSRYRLTIVLDEFQSNEVEFEIVEPEE